MAKLHDDWRVLPHGALRELESNLLTVVGQIPLPLGNFPRRMTVVVLGGGRTALYSPFPLAEPDMARIEALGAPAFLIVPNFGHRLDLRPMKARYPDAKVVTAAAARDKVSEAVPVDSVGPDLGDRAELITVAGCDGLEVELLVRHDGGVTLVTNDIIGNVASPQGPGAWIMSRLTGFGPRPGVPHLIRRNYVKQARELAAQLRAWAAIPGLRRLVPSHGDIIDRPQPVLERIAADLER